MFEILSPALQKIGEVELPTSDNHSIHWQEAGTLALIAVATEYNLRELLPDRYILIRDDLRQAGRLDGLYLICSVSHDESKNEVTVNGKTAGYLLHQRTTSDTVLEGTTACVALAALVTGNARGLPVNAVAAAGDDPEVIRYPIDGGALDEKVNDLMAYCGVGMTATLDGTAVRLTFTAGRDISAQSSVPIIGKNSGWARNGSITVDNSDFYNVAVGTLAFDGGAEEPYVFGDTAATGSNRRELYIGSITQSKGEAEAAFRARADEEAQGKLVSRLLRTTINADISTADYGRPFLVGDIVRVQVGAVTLKKRIVTATWLRDGSNDKVTLTMGDQLNTIVAEVKEQVKSVVSSSGKAAKETKKRQDGIESDFKSLIAQVTDIAAGMDAYVLNKIFEDYKTANARLFAALQEDGETIKSELNLHAESINELQTVSADLATRLKDAESGLALKVSNEDLTETLKNYALASALKDYLTVTTAAELYVTDDDVAGIIGAYIVTDKDGNKKPLAAILADVIKLQGDTEILGNLSVDGGKLKVSKSIVTDGAVDCGSLEIGANKATFGNNDLIVQTEVALSANAMRLGTTTYKPTPITSTSGTVLVLGIA